MLDNLFSNKTNIIILRFLSKFDNQFFTREEISKETGAGLRNTYDSLRILQYEKIISRKSLGGRTSYRFVVDSKVKELIYQIFQEEQERLVLRNLKLFKLISEIELKIIKVAGPNLSDIFLFGSTAKGRDTTGSDVDICVLLGKTSARIEQKIKRIALEKDFSREIQIHVFTLKDFLDAKSKKNKLVMDILRDGISLRIGK